MVWTSEIQKYANGEYGHIVHFAYDEDRTKARLKAFYALHTVVETNSQFLVFLFSGLFSVKKSYSQSPHSFRICVHQLLGCGIYA